MVNLLICFGTRPEWLKIKPIIDVLHRNNYKLLFTGQHPDLLKDIKVDYRIQLNDTSNRLDDVISQCMVQFPTDNFDKILVQGDTASVLGCALAAFNRQIPIYYLEAGLRSFDLGHPYPEEGYRQMVSRISTINLCPTELSKQNLILERVSGECVVVGNTILDSLVKYKDTCEYTNKILVTLHRRENHTIMDQWFTEINKIAVSHLDLEFILPLHPNPNVEKWKSLLSNVTVINPLSHNELLNILIKTKLVITDSGGIQEESTFFNKKVIVCRETTERPEGIDTGHLHLCKRPNELKKLFDKLLKNPYINTDCPYGNGKSAPKIKGILMK